MLVFFVCIFFLSLLPVPLPLLLLLLLSLLLLFWNFLSRISLCLSYTSCLPHSHRSILLSYLQASFDQTLAHQFVRHFLYSFTVACVTSVSLYKPLQLPQYHVVCLCDVYVSCCIREASCYEREIVSFVVCCENVSFIIGSQLSLPECLSQRVLIKVS